MMLLAEDQEVSQQRLTCVRVGVGVRDVGGVEVQLPRGSQVRLDAAHALAVAQLLVLCAQARLAVRLRPHSPPSTPKIFAGDSKSTDSESPDLRSYFRCCLIKNLPEDCLRVTL
jgi:hypothetical protein